jgi:hypothetical protein
MGIVMTLSRPERRFRFMSEAAFGYVFVAALVFVIAWLVSRKPLPAYTDASLLRTIHDVERFFPTTHFTDCWSYPSRLFESTAVFFDRNGKVCETRMDDF